MNLQYVPLDLDMLEDSKMIRLIRKHGMQGLGVYITIIILLWKKEESGFKWGLDDDSIEDICFALRDKNTDRDMVEDIILHFDLFERLPKDDDSECGYFYSKSILRRREKMSTKQQKMSAGGKKGMKLRWGNKEDKGEDITGLKVAIR